MDYITLPQIHHGMSYVFPMAEATTRLLESYPMHHDTAQNTILDLEKQILWQHGTPERIESNNRTHLWNTLIDNWAKEHSTEWACHIP